MDPYMPVLFKSAGLLLSAAELVADRHDAEVALLRALAIEVEANVELLRRVKLPAVNEAYDRDLVWHRVADLLSCDAHTLVVQSGGTLESVEDGSGVLHRFVRVVQDRLQKLRLEDDEGNGSPATNTNLLESCRYVTTRVTALQRLGALREQQPALLREVRWTVRLRNIHQVEEAVLKVLHHDNALGLSIPLAPRSSS